MSLDRSTIWPYRDGELGEFYYSRYDHPAGVEAERALGELDGGHALLFSSGSAASTTAVLGLLSAGQTIALTEGCYYGTALLFRELERWGVRFAEFDQTAAPPDGVDLVWLEAPSNPLLTFPDMGAASAHPAPVLVDATASTPVLFRPLEHGADVVLHSTTKYIGGHSDLIGGFVATSDPTIAERLYFLQKSLGAIPGPFDCWLALRGVKTLALRMRAHSENARKVVAFLDSHAEVERVLYPGLPSHPGHEIAARQMSDFGGMVSFLAETEEDAVALVARTKVFKLAESLGGVESLIEVPALMTHASTAESSFAAPPNLVRVSVGLESPDDLVADLEAALARSPAVA
jgi:cystathionine gamma-synthase